jgi:DNA-binding SARP family transcriptional activator/tetratricopeptide (TPR) repeat protein
VINVRYSVLGAITVHAGATPLPLGPPRQRAVLAYLLLRNGHVVPITQLIDALWGVEPVATARTQVHAAVSGLRATLNAAGAPVISTRRDSYVIDVAEEDVDVLRFWLLLAAARKALGREAYHAAATSARMALRLWRGPALADVSASYVEPARTRLEAERQAAYEVLFDAELHEGHHAEVAQEIAACVEEYPLREKLVCQLMLALYRGGRQAEALAAARSLRGRLVEEHGLDPGAELQDLERAMLTNDPALVAHAVKPTASVTLMPASGHPTDPADREPSDTRPDELPRDLPHFTGRTEALAELQLWLAKHDYGAGGPITITAISGTGGVGKTALAVHWAHSVRDRFPDGQLYINLRGFDPEGTAVTPAEAIRRFLDSLGVPANRVPVGAQAQASLYRTLLAGRRMLVVLDNARDPDQVRPLLPGAPDCLVLITSRNKLTSLVAAEGANTLPLDMLTLGEARDLLTRRLTRHPAATSSLAAPDLAAPDLAAVDEIIDHCGRLPLALAIVAARAATNPHLSPPDLAGELRSRHDRLDLLSTGDAPATDLRAVFSWSYRALDGDAASLFHLLGLHPGPDISLAAVVSLTGMPVGRIRPLLARLAGAHLVDERVPGRYSLHDLVRSYASELAHSRMSEEDRRAASLRMLDHYLQTAYAGDRLLEPPRQPITLASPRPGVVPESFTDHWQALAWFNAEHAVLLAAVRHAAAGRCDGYTWQLGWALFDFFDAQGHWHDQIAVQQAAAAAAERLDDNATQILCHRFSARAHIQLGRFDDAYGHLRSGLDLADRIGDLVSQANIHNSLGHLREQQGRHADALDHARRAVDLFHATGNRHGQANTLNGVGWCYAMLGDYEQALASCRQALAMLQEIDDRHGQCHVWDSLGYIHRQRGQHEQAIACYRNALDLTRDLGLRRVEAEHLVNLGDAHHAAGDAVAARDAWQQALAVLEPIDHPEVESVRAKLAATMPSEQA